ncbi:hypothetical protein EsH8_V_000085 [Colletotrichum jinshuiense]
MGGLLSSWDDILIRARVCQELFYKISQDAAINSQGWVEKRQAEFNIWISTSQITSPNSFDPGLRGDRSAADTIKLLDELCQTLRKLLCAAGGNGTRATAKQKEHLGRIFGKLHVASLSTKVEKSGPNCRFGQAGMASDLTKFDALKVYLTASIHVSHLQSTASLVNVPHLLADKMQSLSSGFNSLTTVQRRLVDANIRRRSLIHHATRNMPSLQVPKTEGFQSYIEEAPLIIMENSPEDSSIPVSLPAIGPLNTPNRQQKHPKEIDHNILRATELQKTSHTATEAARIKSYSCCPPCPKPTSESALLCPYCADLLPAIIFEHESKWSAHVAYDIAPYTCPVERCAWNGIVFISEADLTDHVRQQHGAMKWICDECADNSRPCFFRSAPEFNDHMSMVHVDSPLRDDILFLSETSQTKVIEPSACPICHQPFLNGHSFGLDDHTLQHIYEFTVMSLPCTARDEEIKAEMLETSGDEHSVSSSMLLASPGEMMTPVKGLSSGLSQKSTTNRTDYRYARQPLIPPNYLLKDGVFISYVQKELLPLALAVESIGCGGAASQDPLPGISRLIADPWRQNLEVAAMIAKNFRILIEQISSRGGRISSYELRRWQCALPRIRLTLRQLMDLSMLTPYWQIEERLIWSTQDLFDEFVYLNKAEDNHPGSSDGGFEDPFSERMSVLRESIAIRPEFDDIRESIELNNPRRRLIHEGPVEYVGAKTEEGHNYHAILLDNFFLLTYPSPGTTESYKLRHKWMAVPSKLLLADHVETYNAHGAQFLDGGQGCINIQQLGHKSSFTIRAGSRQMKNTWLNMFAKCKRLHTNDGPFYLRLVIYNNDAYLPPSEERDKFLRMRTSIEETGNQTLNFDRDARRLPKTHTGIVRLISWAVAKTLHDIQLVYGNLFWQFVFSQTNRYAKYGLVGGIPTALAGLYLRLFRFDTVLILLGGSFESRLMKPPHFGSILLPREACRVKDVRFTPFEPDPWARFPIEFALKPLKLLLSFTIIQAYIYLTLPLGFRFPTCPWWPPLSVPGHPSSGARRMAGTISDQFAVAILDLNETEFLVVYERRAVYINKIDCQPSRPKILYFLGNVQNVTKATLLSGYLILFTDQYIEIRVAETGEVRQFIPGSHVRYIGQGKFYERLDKNSLGCIFKTEKFGWNPLNSRNGRSRQDVVRSAMALPEYPNSRFIFDLVLREEPVHRPE